MLGSRIFRLLALAVAEVILNDLVAALIKTTIPGASSESALDQAVDDVVFLQVELVHLIGFRQCVGQRRPDWLHQLQTNVVQQAEHTGARDAEWLGEHGVGKFIRHALLHG